MPPSVAGLTSPVIFKKNNKVALASCILDNMDNKPPRSELIRREAQENYRKAVEFLAQFDRHKNGGRKYATPEEFKAMRKLYKRAHSLVWWREHPGKYSESPQKKEYRRIRSLRPAAMRAFYLEIETAEELPCYYCGVGTNRGSRTVDHKTPISRGGEHILENVCCACRTCNSSKGKLTAEEFLANTLPPDPPSRFTDGPQLNNGE